LGYGLFIFDEIGPPQPISKPTIVTSKDWGQNSLIFLFEQYDIDSYWGRIDEAKSDLNQSPAFEIAETKRGSAGAGRLCLRWRKGSKNPFNNLSRQASLAEMDRAA
jgi:hypothetical protein